MKMKKIILINQLKFMTDKKYLIERFVDYLCIFFPYILFININIYIFY